MKMMLNISGVHISEEVDVKNISDIIFPEHSEEHLLFAVDIGGSLTKIVYFVPNAGDSCIGGTLKFRKFETSRVEEALAFIKSFLNPTKSATVLLATGGGSVKYNDLIKSTLSVTVERHDEMECLVGGINFLVKNVPNEVFTYNFDSSSQFVDVDKQNMYPYMLVNMGSGVSIIKVLSETMYERVSGTSLGGGTFVGLLSLFLREKASFDELLKLSLSGNNGNIDMLVGDIYGRDYSKIGLKSTVIASSAGKALRMSSEELKNVETKDFAQSVLYMIANNIGQIAYLNAKQHGIDRIYFGGYYICGHPITMNALSYAINFWSKGSMKAMFLRHEGYIGALGAFLSR